MTETELDDFKGFIAMNPDAGVRLKGAGGIRKVRWATADKGKRGGVRVIYYYYDDEIPLFLLSVYSKARQESLAEKEVAELGRLARILVDTYKGGRDE